MDEEAMALYEACPSVKPSWDQLGETTKDVWRERAAMMDELQSASPHPGDVL